jgi:putative flavoprotein involved in K+ transport
MGLPARVHTVVIGAGHSGLAMSRLLGEAGRDHVVLERRPSLGGGWQDRWDSFRLVTPNWTTSLPGFPYEGPDADDYMSRDRIAARVARYADVIDAPVHVDTGVDRLTARSGGGFTLDTTGGTVEAREVVVATGSFHASHTPELSAAMPRRLVQLHSHHYRRADQLPPGGVLIVGSGQSGVQIAEELMDAGRPTYLALGSAGWAPRRYRGRDLFRWLVEVATRGAEIGVPFPTVDTLPDRRARLAANPQLTGHGGGHDVDLRGLAASGLTLLGRPMDVAGERLRLAPGLSTMLARTEQAFDQRFRPLIDRFIERAAIEAPPYVRTLSSFEPPEIDELDLSHAGISTVIWATGYRPDFRWIDLPTLDDMGFPRHRRGVSDVPGLYFLGLLWQHTQASATLIGPRLDAPYLAEAMGAASAQELAGASSSTRIG